MGREESSALPIRWQPWTRLAWALAAVVSVATFAGTLLLTRQFANDLPERLVLGLAALGWSADGWFWFTVATIAPLFLTQFCMGMAIYWLRPHDRMAFFTSIFLMTFGAANSFTPAPEYLSLVAAAPRAFTLINFACGLLSFGLMGVFFATFPDGRFVPRWMGWLAPFGFLLALAWNLYPETIGTFSGPFGAAALVAVLLLFGGSLIAQIWRYRHHSSPIQKQQTKWFIYGLALGAGMLFPATALYGLHATDPRTGLLIDLFVGVANLAFIFLPLSIGIAILRYRLWDIDVIIRKTLQYALLTGILALVYFGSVTLLQSAVSAVSGQQSAIATVLSTLAIAALFSPLRGRVQAWIDRRFYRRKYDAQQVLAAFALTARDETDLDSLTRELQRVAVETMQPESAGVWLFGATAGRGERV